MALAARVRLPKLIVTYSIILSVPSEIRIQIYQEVFRGLEVQLFHSSSTERPACSTLVNMCQVCHTFLVEARQIFLRTVSITTHANLSPHNKILRLSFHDCRSIRNLVIFVTKEHSCDYSSLARYLLNLEQLTIDLTPWRPAYLDIERAMKSKDTVVITDSDAEYDEDKRIGVNRLFATFEDWVKDLAIERASAGSKDKFKLMLRLDFINELDDSAPTTTVKCEIDVLSRMSTIEIPGSKAGVLKLAVLIGRGLHPNAVSEALI